MQQAPDVIETYRQRLHELADIDSIRALTSDTLDRMGFRDFAYHIVQLPGIDSVERQRAIGITSYPDQWSRHYSDNNCVDFDPVVLRAKETRKTFFWNDEMSIDKLTKRQLRLLDDAGGLAIANGLTSPLLSRNGEFAAFSVIPGSSLSRVHVTPDVVNLVRLMGEYLHSHTASIVVQNSLMPKSKRRKSLLSPREAETLGWVARGKSSWEISVILSLSEKSVEFYLDSVRLKLGATNRTHAVVRAMIMGLISLET